MSKLKRSHAKQAKKVQRSKSNVHGATSATTRGVRSLPTAHCSLPTASVEDQIAMLEAQIAALASGKDTEANPEARSPTPEVRAKLPAPTNLDATAFGSSFLRVSWGTVTNASGYLVQYSSDSAFVNDVNALMVDAPGTSVTLSGLKADTMYHVHVKAIAFDGDTDSEFSLPYLVRTGIASNAETAKHLQTWLDEQQSLLQSFSTLVPEIESTVLTTGERRRLLGSGVRRYGFIDKVSDTAVAYSQFWPDYAGGGEEQLKTLIREIEVLRNLLVFYESGARTMQDLLLIKGDEAFRLASTYYATVRTAARRRVPDAEAVFQLLRLFWKRRRNMSAETTIPEVERDMRALLRGTKDGEIIVRNESDRVVKGERVIIDETQRPPRGGVKVVEHGEVE